MFDLAYHSRGVDVGESFLLDPAGAGLELNTTGRHSRRFSLIRGRSDETVPQYARRIRPLLALGNTSSHEHGHEPRSPSERLPLPRCDVISIDGGHTLWDAMSDLIHTRRLAHPCTIGFIDDTPIPLGKLGVKSYTGSVMGSFKAAAASGRACMMTSVGIATEANGRDAIAITPRGLTTFVYSNLL